jgi:hypothetical protein
VNYSHGLRISVLMIIYLHPGATLEESFKEKVKKFTCKAKAVPLQASGDPEGSRNLRFPDFLTTAQDGGKVASLTHRPHLPPGNTPGTHFC